MQYIIEMNTPSNKKQISKKLKEKAINEGFTIAGIAKFRGVRA